jgi:hypothetical protein
VLFEKASTARCQADAFCTSVFPGGAIAARDPNAYYKYKGYEPATMSTCPGNIQPETRDQGEAIQQPPAGRYEIIAEDLCSVVRAALPFADSVTFRRPGQIFARRAGVNRSAPAPKPPLDHELLLSNAAIVAAALEIRINLQTFTRRCRLAGEVEFPDSTHICRSS